MRFQLGSGATRLFIIPRHLMLQVSPHIAALLQRVMEDGHVLTEPEMVQLFATRGADFHVSIALQLAVQSAQ